MPVNNEHLRLTLVVVDGAGELGDADYYRQSEERIQKVAQHPLMLQFVDENMNRPLGEEVTFMPTAAIKRLCLSEGVGKDAMQQAITDAIVELSCQPLSDGLEVSHGE